MTVPVKVHLNIGSNIGDSAAMIGRAVADLASTPGVERIEVSTPVESEPLGFESPNRFVNVGVAVMTVIGPLQLLDIIQAIERRHSSVAHRNPDGSYRDRELDIDIITYGDLVIDTPRLSLPHPRMADRPFVLGPMAELERRILGLPGWL